MWRPSLSNVGKLTVASFLLLASAEAEACLFPCLWGWGGYYGPPPVYSAPVYGGPVYAPSPCGPGGCGTGGCGPGGCSSFYGPTACCSTCSSCCDVGCSTCSGGNCAGGDCAANYNSKMEATPDHGPKKQPTYSPEPKDEPPMPGDMPPDDFLPPARPGDGAAGGTGGPSTSTNPSPAGTTPPAEPMPENILPDSTTLHVQPVRQRTDVRAQYRVPRVARLQVAPPIEWQRLAEGRLAKR